MLEQKGIPSVVMGTTEFEQLAKLESKNRGMADLPQAKTYGMSGLPGLAELPLALIPHPLGGIREDEVVKKADLAVEVVRKAVTRA